MNSDISDEVVNTAKRIEEMDSPDDLDPLEVEVTCNLQGDVKEIVLVLGVGGPYIEYNASKGTVYGAWGGDTHTTHVNNDSLGYIVRSRYAEHFRATR